MKPDHGAPTPPAPCLRPGCPSPGTELTAVDAHAGGEPGRVIVGGAEDVPGATMFEKMRHLATYHDDLRLRMLREPRGYPAANCNLVLPPTSPAAAAGFVIMEQVEYPPMSGTNTICVTTVLIDRRMVEVHEPVTSFTLETPAGLVRVKAEVVGGHARRVTFENVPCFAMQLDAPVEVAGMGTVRVDLAYGGMLYVIADAAALGLRLAADEARDLVRVGECIKAAAREQVPQYHPDQPELVGPTIACLVGPAQRRPRRPAQRRRRFHRHPRLATAGHLDRCPRPLPVRDRHLRADGRSPRPGAVAPGPRFPQRGDPGHRVHGPAGGRGAGSWLPRGGPDHYRYRVDHGL